MPDDRALGQILTACTLVGPDRLSLRGGTAGATARDLGPLVEALAGLAAPPGFAWMEWTDRMRLREGEPAVPEDPARLVHARWFGAGGDLELWRSGDVFHWRFVGPPLSQDLLPLSGGRDWFGERDGAAHGPRLLRQGPERIALLWEPDDARIAGADGETREYLASHGRLAVRYVPYLDHGVTAAVWYQGIEEVSRGGGAAETDTHS